MSATEKITSDFVDLKQSVRDFTQTIESFTKSATYPTKTILEAIIASDKFLELKNKSK